MKNILIYLLMIFIVLFSACDSAGIPVANYWVDDYYTYPVFIRAYDNQITLGYQDKEYYPTNTELSEKEKYEILYQFYVKFLAEDDALNIEYQNKINELRGENR